MLELKFRRFGKKTSIRPTKCPLAFCEVLARCHSTHSRSWVNWRHASSVGCGLCGFLSDVAGANYQ